ncbi:hypothetical protein LPMP_205320 [Leishmania panamensis]|uniref:Pre-mRNA-splicing factor 38 n=5 Tax=Viannia TaxID=37616 RepID=E9AIG4_LEIBR|nr:conserved hypothetical protein [Leishmania braziliensis MHOM/BR/75/M2904]XP_010698731.1 hypothetical protein LPMP_205320 [Leishmania panamensis]KAI5686782.1 PRP38 family [Leishmania braziliensis]CCM15257.1 hypothetical protein, conserved [Leishmania guyanensis]AIN98024.1 hypothetical protein LPMP_205320 [Leishmania panamensis]CAJ2472037.1 unnamed protein product [Leishmania braziliensis]CAJ2472552.1 unnamed protein product [Leishmania braziliensis]
MSWNLKGRAAIAALDPPTRHRVLHSQTMTRCANKPLLWVLEELTTLRSLGGLTGPLHRANYFICLVVRLLQICPSVAIARVMLEQDVHKYLRAAALLLIRFIGNMELQREAMHVGWSDYRKLCLYGSDPAQEWKESTSATVAGAGGMATDTFRTLASSMLPLDHYKRPRAEMEMCSGNSNLSGDAQSSEFDRANAHAPEPPRYLLIRMDEFTDYVFGVPPASTASQSKGAEELLKTPASPPIPSTPGASSRTLPGHTFMGLYFPALIV